MRSNEYGYYPAVNTTDSLPRKAARVAAKHRPKQIVPFVVGLTIVFLPRSPWLLKFHGVEAYAASQHASR